MLGILKGIDFHRLPALPNFGSNFESCKIDRTSVLVNNCYLVLPRRPQNHWPCLYHRDHKTIGHVWCYHGDQKPFLKDHLSCLCHADHKWCYHGDHKMYLKHPITVLDSGEHYAKARRVGVHVCWLSKIAHPGLVVHVHKQEV